MTFEEKENNSSFQEKGSPPPPPLEPPIAQTPDLNILFYTELALNAARPK